MANSREILNFGHGDLETNPKLAIARYIQAGDMGLAQGYYEAGKVCFRNTYDIHKAEKYLLKAASLNYAPAYNELAKFYANDSNKASRYARLYEESRNPLSNSNGLFYPASINNGKDCFGQPIIPAIKNIEAKREEIRAELVERYGEDQVELAEIFALKHWADIEPHGYAEESGALARLLAKHGALEEAQKYFDYYLSYIENPPEGMGLLNVEGTHAYRTRELEKSFLHFYGFEISPSNSGMEFTSQNAEEIFWYAQKLKEEKKLREAWRYFTQAADLGNSDALYYCSFTLMNAGEKKFLYSNIELRDSYEETSYDFLEAEKYLIALSEQNDARGYLLLANLYYRHREAGNNKEKFDAVAEILNRHDEEKLKSICDGNYFLTKALIIFSSFGGKPRLSEEVNYKRIMGSHFLSIVDRFDNELGEAWSNTNSQLYTPEQLENFYLDYGIEYAERSDDAARTAAEIYEKRGDYIQALKFTIILKGHVEKVFQSTTSDFEKDQQKKNLDAIKLKLEFLESKSSTQETLKQSSAQNPTSNVILNYPLNSEEQMEILNSMIGLTEVKEEIRKFSQTVKARAIRASIGQKIPELSYHMVFTGNPGTGKTTVARTLGSIYQSMGFLKRGHLIEVEAKDLIADYLGQTAGKTRKKIDEAMDGVLFIDEAYTLTPDRNNPYGGEAVATLLTAMENHSDRLAVVIAGYKTKMPGFISSNPGLQSRFTRYIDFPDYSPAELTQIFQKLAKDDEFTLEMSAIGALKEHFEIVCADKGPNFGNARMVRNLYQAAVQRQDDRIVNDNIMDANLVRLLTLDDLSL